MLCEEVCFQPQPLLHSLRGSHNSGPYSGIQANDTAPSPHVHFGVHIVGPGVI